MNTRDFLVRGLLAGLLAGLATFAVAFAVGEPHVDAAIALEESAAAPAAAHGHDTAHSHGDPAGDAHEHAEAGHSHGEEAVVSRSTQKSWGLLTGSLGLGVALGGVVGVVAAFAAGRTGRLSSTGSTALVAAAGWVAFSLVPFLKYPATPPAVGDASTIGARTTDYFGFLLVSVVAAGLAVWLGVRLARRHGGFAGVVAGAAAYLLLVIIAGQLFPTVNEVGDFPADTLWYFRRASLLTLTSLWAVIALVLVGLVGRQQGAAKAAAERRALAASL